MQYLKEFKLLSVREENDLLAVMKNIHSSYYPFHLFDEKISSPLLFDDVTIFCGENGSGKTTLLNIIADTLNAYRRNASYQGELFESYVNRCSFEISEDALIKEIKLISSDDVFDALLDLRAINSSVSRRKAELVNEYMHARKDENHITDALGQYEALKNQTDARRMTASHYVRNRLTGNNIPLQSNGESALQFWQSEIKEDALYIIDEPENSLSALNQLKLKQYIEESVRFFHCQFIIATHSPFLSGIENALIYDLDSDPIETVKWEELESVRECYTFFKEREDRFE